MKARKILLALFYLLIISYSQCIYAINVKFEVVSTDAVKLTLKSESHADSELDFAFIDKIKRMIETDLEFRGKKLTIVIEGCILGAGRAMYLANVATPGMPTVIVDVRNAILDNRARFHLTRLKCPGILFKALTERELMGQRQLYYADGDMVSSGACTAAKARLKASVSHKLPSKSSAEEAEKMSILGGKGGVKRIQKLFEQIREERSKAAKAAKMAQKAQYAGQTQEALKEVETAKAAAESVLELSVDAFEAMGYAKEEMLSKSQGSSMTTRTDEPAPPATTPLEITKLEEDTQKEVVETVRAAASAERVIPSEPQILQIGDGPVPQAEAAPQATPQPELPTAVTVLLQPEQQAAQPEQQTVLQTTLIDENTTIRGPRIEPQAAPQPEPQPASQAWWSGYCSVL